MPSVEIGISVFQIKEKKIDVTCVVIGHRESHIIAATIKSVLRANEVAVRCGANTEIVVVLDDPDDDTTSVVSTFEDQGCLIETVFYKDLSCSRNHATKIANGKYIAFVDGDDLWCKSWVISSLLMAQSSPGCVFHPEYNIYFGDMHSHVLHHVDMQDSDFVLDAVYKENYWTALSFSERRIYMENPYLKNEISGGFGYEDWTWNVETIDKGIKHRTVPGTCHFIRRNAGSQSLLNISNSASVLPTILPIYKDANQKESTT